MVKSFDSKISFFHIGIISHPSPVAHFTLFTHRFVIIITLLNNLRKYITPLILVIALFAINGSEFMHHHDYSDFTKQDDSGSAAHKCQACIFNNLLRSTLTVDTFVFIPLAVTYSPVTKQLDSVPQTDGIESSLGRAPPQLSHI